MKKQNLRLFLYSLVAAVGVATAWVSGQAHAEVECVPDRVELRGPWGQAKFRVEIADTAEERARGLMFREHLPASQGMLFLFPQPARVSFWMKNTLIPLDMIFIDPQGTVVSVHHDAIPGDLTGISGGDGTVAVLEINGGFARRIGISPGSLMRHPGLPQHLAVWPC